MDADVRFPRWAVVLLVVVGLGAAALIYGPRLYEAGGGLVGPMSSLVGLERQVKRLDGAMPFEPPAEAVIRPRRLDAFLELRRELAPRLEAWSRTVNEAKARGESWKAVKGILGQLQSLMEEQVQLHERLGISPAEARWCDDIVYGQWLPAVEKVLAANPATASARAAQAREDLEFVAGLEARYGASAATRAMRRRLSARLDEIENPPRPAVAGLPAQTQELLWSRREEIAKLEISDADEAPLLYRKGGRVTVPLDKD
jgi:hypothetical protein